MCGRTCLTLEPNEIQCACKYQTKTSENNKNNSNNIENDDKNKKKSEENVDKINLKTPEWRSEYNFGKKYQPSFNISPSIITPVLTSTKHFSTTNHDNNSNSSKYKRDDENDDNQQTRILVPMMWGMIPFWHKGDYRKHGLTTNNCRLEHMLESKLYRRPFQRGQRCVILCEGFYEWQTTKSAKPSERSVYYIHMPQIDDIKIHDKNTWKNSIENLKLLKMAGLFDIWEDGNGDKIYSYAIITYESTDTLSWLHHRMPAILETEEQVDDWLDYERVSCKDALSVLRISPKLLWYQVSNIVNNSRNQSDQCNKPIEYVKNVSGRSILPKSKIMQSWLNIRKRKEDILKKKFADNEDEDDDGGSDDIDEDEMPKPKYRREHGSETEATNISKIVIKNEK